MLQKRIEVALLVFMTIGMAILSVMFCSGFGRKYISLSPAREMISLGECEDGQGIRRGVRVCDSPPTWTGGCTAVWTGGPFYACVPSSYVSVGCAAKFSDLPGQYDPDIGYFTFYPIGCGGYSTTDCIPTIFGCSTSPGASGICSPSQQIGTPC